MSFAEANYATIRATEMIREMDELATDVDRGVGGFSGMHDCMRKIRFLAGEVERKSGEVCDFLDTLG